MDRLHAPTVRQARTLQELATYGVRPAPATPDFRDGIQRPACGAWQESTSPGSGLGRVQTAVQTRTRKRWALRRIIRVCNVRQIRYHLRVVAARLLARAYQDTQVYKARLRAWLVPTANSKANMGRWPVRTAHSTHSRVLVLPRRMHSASASQGSRDHLQDRVPNADKASTKVRWAVCRAPCARQARIQKTLAPLRYRCAVHVRRISTRLRAVTTEVTACAMQGRFARNALGGHIKTMLGFLQGATGVRKASFTTGMVPGRLFIASVKEGLRETLA